MEALRAGTRAPDFALPDMSGNNAGLRELLVRGPVVLAFFKISCPVCQYAFPFLQRIYHAAAGKNVAVVGVSQNSQKDTQFFNRQFGITFPILLDDPRGYKVSNAYGLTNVPTIFYIAQDGTIEISSVGWNKQDVLEIARRVSEQTQSAAIQAIAAGEQVADFRAG